MKIGVDIDGVILNFERTLNTFAEFYNFDTLKNGGAKNRNEHHLKKRFEWTDEQKQAFIDKYFLELSKTCPMMPGAVHFINMLKNDGHELVIITARGKTVPEMKQVAEQRFKENGLVFDKYYWCQDGKLQTAVSEKLDFMIDDYLPYLTEISNAGIKCLYFKDVNMQNAKETENLIEVTNWGEVYRIVTENSQNK